MREFRMPSLGADMAEGTLVEWLVRPGDVVHRGDLIATVDTSKSAIDVEVFSDGRIDTLLVDPGTTVAVGTPLAMLAELDGEALREPTAPPPVASVPAPEVTKRRQRRSKAVSAPRDAHVGAWIAASPLARRRAHELGIDLSTVHPDHTSGVITVADVDACSAMVPALPAEVQPAAQEPARDQAMRSAIGALMARSKREIPHYYLQSTFDLEPALTWLEHTNAQRPVAERIVPAALLLKATARAARQFPDMNGFYRAGGYEPQTRINLGVAVSLRSGGLIAPALHDVDVLALDGVMAGMKDLVSRARSGHLRSSEMSDPTLTVTNLGDQGAELVHGVIYPPQVALVGFGRIVERPWSFERMLTVRRQVIATLAADHRVSDGHRGGLFLAAIDAALQRPEEL